MYQLVEYDAMMHATQVQEHARMMFQTFGGKAIAEAAQKARTFENEGDKGQADDWRRIEAALRQLHGPKMS